MTPIRQPYAAHRFRRWAAFVVLGLLLTGCGGTEGGKEALGVPGPVVTPESTPPTEEWSPGLPDAPTPRRVLLPRLKIDARLDPLGLDKARVLIPPEYGRAGWYEDGPEPGEPGRVVVAGHLDSKTGPDVFARLGEAKKGDRIVVRLENGAEVAYKVQSVDTFLQSAFPTDRVYGGSDTPEIRLITCGGSYDRKRGRYESNVVVFARLVS